MSETTNIAFGNIANALKSMASDHILAVAEDIYDVGLEKYQSTINASILTQDNAAETYLPLAGGTMIGTINSNSVLPTTNLTYDIGSSTKSYNKTYTRYIDTLSGYDLRFMTGGTEHIRVQASDGALIPFSTGTKDIGSSTLKFKNIYGNNIYGTTIYENGTNLASKYATPTYVDNKIAGLVNSAPSTLDTLNELAAALGDDANFSTTITNLIGTKTTGPSESTSENIVVFNGTSGKELKDSGKKISDFSLADHTHSYAGSSSAGGAATSANKLNKITGAIPSACATPGLALTYYTLAGTTADENNKRYAGDNTGFPVSSNANSILWLGNHTHSSDSTQAGYGGQMGISSNGNLYYRFITNGAFPTTADGGSWKQLAFTTLATTSASGLMSTSDKTKLDGISAGAEVNVQSDWSVTDTSSDAYILNKPNLAVIATSGDYNDLTNKPNLAAMVDAPYLTIEVLEDECTVGFSTNTIQYSTDLNTWSNLTPGSTVSANAGDKVYFKANLTPASYNGIGTFTVSKKFNLSGNCNSMLFGDDAATNLDLTGYDYAFYLLFQRCNTLQSISSTFLPATMLASNCYQYMFYRCTALAEAPELPATKLADYCYDSMFSDCTALTTSPELPATILASYCYRYMFYDCSNLNYIKMLATNISAENCLNNWVYGVSSTGTFMKNANAKWTTSGFNGIPKGWLIEYPLNISGGTTGQILAKTSNITHDTDWVSVKTINNQSILGTGNITIEGGGNSIEIVQETGNSTTAVMSQNAVTELTERIYRRIEPKYEKPSTGIPKTDLASAVQTSLDKADTALQEHQDISGKQDKLISGINIKTINNQSLLGSGNISIESGGELSCNCTISPFAGYLPPDIPVIDMSTPSTNGDVLYDMANNRFVFREKSDIITKYYSNWTDAYLYNDNYGTPDAIARKGKIFSHADQHLIVTDNGLINVSFVVERSEQYTDSKIVESKEYTDDKTVEAKEYTDNRLNHKIQYLMNQTAYDAITPEEGVLYLIGDGQLL